MSAVHGADPGGRGVRHDDPVDPHYVMPAIIGALIVAVVIAVLLSLSGSASQPVAATPGKSLPAFWTVHTGDSYTSIASKTGLSVDQIETFNPYTNPAAIRPGQKLKLRLHVPGPKPRPKGPRSHTVRTGETFASIARKTHHDVSTLIRLNPKIQPEQLQPGARLRLRR
jgi:LysM repeat protein